MAHDLPETAGKAAAPAASFRKCRRARSIADLPYRSKDVENAGHKTRPRQYPMLLYWNNAIFASIDSRAPRTMTILSLVRPSLWHAGNFRCDLTRVRLGFLRQAPHSWHFRWTAPLCGRHPLQRHKPADVVDEVL